MKRILLLILTCVFSASVFAGSEGSTDKKQPHTKDTIISLSKRTDNKTARIPSLTSPQTVGTYDENGIFSAYLPEDSIWTMVITATDGEMSTYYVSTHDLQQGVYVGVMSAFTITLTNDYGISYIGEVYL